MNERHWLASAMGELIWVRERITEASKDTRLCNNPFITLCITTTTQVAKNKGVEKARGT